VKSRLVAAVALSAAVMLGASGCAMTSPQATLIPYSPGDGLNIPENGAPLIVRNALLVANETGRAGNLVAAVVNSTALPARLTVQVGEGAAAVTQTLIVPANTIKSLGANAEPLLFAGIDAKPGSTVQMSFQSGARPPVAAEVPVLNNNQGYYTGLVPRPVASALLGNK